VLVLFLHGYFTRGMMTERQEDQAVSELIVVLTLLGTALVAVVTVCLIEGIYLSIKDFLED